MATQPAASVEEKSTASAKLVTLVVEAPATTLEKPLTSTSPSTAASDASATASSPCSEASTPPPPPLGNAAAEPKLKVAESTTQTSTVQEQTSCASSRQWRQPARRRTGEQLMLGAQVDRRSPQQPVEAPQQQTHQQYQLLRTTQQQLSAQPHMHSGEVFFMDLLSAMDKHMHQLRETQQGLVATVEIACRRALGNAFGRLTLVGSAALRVETPGSDVDVVCFTRHDGTAPASLPVDALRQIHWALVMLVEQYPDSGANFSMELIDVARVPILRVLWGPPGGAVAVDVSVDQIRPVEHVRWFQRVGAAPRPVAPPPAVAPLVTLTLRCVKWWLRQRQIPRTREGGLPTLAWLLMAVHVCSLPETLQEAVVSSQRPMAALLGSLGAFFHAYTTPAGLDGALVFAADGSSSTFQQRAPQQRGPWAELAVLDPTREGPESLNLVPRLPPAAQVLLTHELQRAAERLQKVPVRSETKYGDSQAILEEVFAPMAEGANMLPSTAADGLGVLLLWGEIAKGQAVAQVAIIDYIAPRRGWTAPFLHRADERSELHCRLCDTDERTGSCTARMVNVVAHPCQFICRAELERGAGGLRLDAQGLDRLLSMRRHLEAVAAQQAEKSQAPQVAGPDQASKDAAAQPSSQGGLAAVPSPLRARHSQTVRI